MAKEIKVLKINKSDSESYIESRLKFYLDMGWQIKEMSNLLIILEKYEI
jgi:hypothetical protein